MMRGHVVGYIGTNVSKKPATSTFRLSTLHFQGMYPEYVGSRFLKNFGTYLQNYTASHLRSVILCLFVVTLHDDYSEGYPNECR
jgi:hypothetical protein